MKKSLLSLAVGVLAAVVAGPAAAQTFNGVVIAKAQARHAIVVASPSGVARTVRTSQVAPVGSRVHVVAQRLADGTYGHAHLSLAGHAKTAVVKSIVVSHTANAYVLAAGGTAIAAQADATYAAGAVLDTTLSIEPTGKLDVSSAQTVAASSVVQLDGTVVSVSADALVIASAGQSLSLALQAGSAPLSLQAGAQVELVASVSAGGSYTLLSVAADATAQASVAATGSTVSLTGTVVASAGGSLVVQPDGSALAVTFNASAGVDLSAATVGSTVDVSGHVAADGSVTLVGIQVDATAADQTVSGTDTSSTTAPADASAGASAGVTVDVGGSGGGGGVTDLIPPLPIPIPLPGLG